MNAQRWRERRDSYRPAGEPIRTSAYDVAEIPDDTTARAFVRLHHYSGSYPAARMRAGLYRGGELVGVAVLSHPMNDLVLSNTFPNLSRLEAAELGRFVLLDDVPANGETWMLARVFELARASGIRGIVSFSDPIPRDDEHGRRLFPGHVGTIYQAHNARYLGRADGRTLHVLPDATVISHRSETKVARAVRGWRPVVATLVKHGADPLDVDADEGARRAWIGRWLHELTRPLQHPGNFRYAWPLDRRVRLAQGAPYPKRRAG